MRTLRWAIGASFALAVAAPGAVTAGTGGGHWFSFRDAAIGESSGVAVATTRDGVMFTHNDSGDAPRFFAVDAQGCTLARYTLPGAKAVDWEDMTRGPDTDGSPALWFGDIGDNLHRRSGGVSLYKVDEPAVNNSGSRTSDTCPAVSDHPVSWARYDLAYPRNPAEGPQDAETLMADPVTGQLFIVTKTYAGEASVYAAPQPLVEGAVNELELVAVIVLPASATLPPIPPSKVDPVDLGFDVVGRFNTTGGDISPDGRRVVVRTYLDAYEWDITGSIASTFAPTVQPRRIAIPYRPQGEAVAYSADGNELILTTEGEFGAVDRVAISR